MMPYKDPEIKKIADRNRYLYSRKKAQHHPVRYCKHCNFPLPAFTKKKKRTLSTRKFCSVTCQMISCGKWNFLAWDFRRLRKSNVLLHASDPLAITDGRKLTLGRNKIESPDVLLTLFLFSTENERKHLFPIQPPLNPENDPTFSLLSSGKAFLVHSRNSTTEPSVA